MTTTLPRSLFAELSFGTSVRTGKHESLLLLTVVNSLRLLLILLEAQEPDK